VHLREKNPGYACVHSQEKGAEKGRKERKKWIGGMNNKFLGPDFQKILGRT